MADSNKINKDNFEKFYKDFTEGRLDEKRRVELFSFMEAHADWLEEDSSAFVLIPLDNESLNNDFKQTLLQVNYEQEAIVPSNTNAFLNAKIEGLLSEESDSKLAVYLDENPQFEKDLKLLSRIKLEADYKIQYPNKSELKRQQTKLLWPIIAAAACVAGLLMFNINWNTEKLQSAIQNTPVKKQMDALHVEVSMQQNDEVKKENIWVHQFQEDYTFSDLQNTPWDSLNDLIVVNPKNEIDTLEILEDKLPLINTEIFKTPKEIFISSNTENKEFPVNNTTNHLAMNNPIHPITNGLSYLTQQEIDFRMANDASNKKGRYFLKVGKLEILHIEN